MRFLAYFLLLSLCLPLQAGNTAQPDPVDSDAAFALDLYHAMEAEGNLFFSPYSVATALAMTYMGARGETAAQMAEACHFASDRERVAADFAERQKTLRSLTGDSLALYIANALWAQRDYPFLPAFRDLVTTRFQAGYALLDFKHALADALQTINQWVAGHTNNMIPELLTPSDLDALTRLVLTNAVYFKANWRYTFAKQDTQRQPFYSPKGEVQVPLMHQENRFAYGETKDLHILELPYTKTLSMVVLLPRSRTGLPQLEKSLSPAALNTWLGMLGERKLHVYLPAFALDYRASLKAPLKALGMVNAFGRNPDFSGMDGSRTLYISDVIHQAKVIVNEQGTEAAAATAVVMKRVSVMHTPVFRADHPFIFLIREKKTGSVLFMGRLLSPA